MGSPKILIVEDDDYQAGWLVFVLQRVFPESEVQLCETESQFQITFPLIAVTNPPDIVIMDIMLRWQNHGQDISVPYIINRESFYRAGFRCQKSISIFLPDTPVIMYSCLELSDIAMDLMYTPQNVSYVSKCIDPTILLNRIVTLLNLDPTQDLDHKIASVGSCYHDFANLLYFS